MPRDKRTIHKEAHLSAPQILSTILALSKFECMCWFFLNFANHFKDVEPGSSNCLLVSVILTKKSEREMLNDTEILLMLVNPALSVYCTESLQEVVNQLRLTSVTEVCVLVV